MSKARSISAKELASIAASVGIARARAVEQTPYIRSFQKLLRTTQKRTEGDLAKRALFWLKVGQNRDLREPSYASVIAAAAKRNDHRFFIRLGQILSRKPYTLKSVMQEARTKRIAWFLVDHWAEKKDGLPELFRLSPAGLADVVRYYVRALATEDSIVKVRQRLGLVAFKRTKISVELIDGMLKSDEWLFPKRSE